MPLRINSKSADYDSPTFILADIDLHTDIFIIYKKNWCPGTLSIKFNDIIITTKPNTINININVYYLGNNTNIQEISNDGAIQFKYMKIYDHTNTNYFVLANAKDQERIMRNLEDVCKGLEEFSSETPTTTNTNKENNEMAKIIDTKCRINKAKDAPRRSRISSAVYTAHNKRDRSAFDVNGCMIKNIETKERIRKISDNLNEDQLETPLNKKERIILNKCSLSIQIKELGCKIRAIEKKLYENENSNILTDKGKINLEIMRTALESECAKIPEDFKKVSEEVEIFVSATIERDNFNKSRNLQSDKRSLSQEIVDLAFQKPSRNPKIRLFMIPAMKKSKSDKLNGVKKLKK